MKIDGADCNDDLSGLEDKHLTVLQDWVSGQQSCLHLDNMAHHVDIHSLTAQGLNCTPSVVCAWSKHNATWTAVDYYYILSRRCAPCAVVTSTQPSPSPRHLSKLLLAVFYACSSGQEVHSEVPRRGTGEGALILQLYIRARYVSLMSMWAT